MDVKAIISILLLLLIAILFTFFPEDAIQGNTKIPIRVKKGDSKTKEELKLFYRVCGVFFFILTFVVTVIVIVNHFQ